MTDTKSHRGANGALRAEVAKLIANGIRTRDALVRVLGDRKVPVSQVLDALHSMSNDGLVSRGRGNVYSLTSQGWLLAPRPQSLAQITGEYRPATPAPRRPGSMVASTLPSLAAGRLVPRGGMAA